MKRMGREMTDKEILAMMNELNIKDNGHITFE